MSLCDQLGFPHQAVFLVLAPHTDDAEFGCGATIARLVEEGQEVWCAIFSDCHQSLPEGWDSETIVKECRLAMKQLGIPDGRAIFYDFPVRRFDEYRQAILEKLVKLNTQLAPSCIFMPCLNDLHQDHQVIAAEGLRAFRKTTVLSYEMPWNNISFETRCFVCLDERHVEKKIAAIMEYKSQSNRVYANPEFVRSLAITRGTQIGTKYAEAFQVERWVLS